MTTASFNIPIIDDHILENNEDVQIEINVSSLPSRVSVSNPGQSTVTIVDNDSKINCTITICTYCTYLCSCMCVWISVVLVPFAGYMFGKSSPVLLKSLMNLLLC